MNSYIGCVIAGTLLCCGPVAATPATERGCTRIVSSLERLACFDQAAGTPIVIPALKAGAVTRTVPAAITLLQANEARRQTGQSGFVMSITPESAVTALEQVMISAPAIESADQRVYLAISCQSNISRLQLLLDAPLARHSAEIQLLLDGRAVSQARPWRVLEGGVVVDAGRGLPAVDLIKRLGSGSRIQVRSDEASLDGLLFDADGLAPLIKEERRACHW
ncbi:type VI secretion system-associated protein TagO [Pseudomonas sp. MAFF212428]|uniref:Type VI secretion system-associated protein TagO n=1 Tax=Pseudomonas brassicae TaxID=2708063 RepID=A0A6B3NP35_9PSED|nr:type VI secretion system-associated protein VasI [Pseudomonas brassicae]NER60160.1 type VI secretion system-associated protein TagO [Pseudomonas brassicae]NER63879.1 type VI secretion system-associated protein TagO [Pseudomonas brassicae]